MKTVAGLLYLLCAVLMPVLGVWLASSLVSFHGGPTEVALVAGALLFPVLPVLWELRATAAFKQKLERRKQFGAPPKRSFSPLGRIVLRTLALNVLFLAVLAVWFPKVAFPALATRGDWFLDGKTEPWAEKMRGDLHAAASGLEWLYELSHQNPYVKEGDVQPVPDTVKPTLDSTFLAAPTARRWIPGGSPWRDTSRQRVAEPTPKPEPEPDPLPGREPTRLRESEPQPEPVPAWLDGSTYVVGETRWPWKAEPAKSLARLTPADEASIAAVAAYFRREEPEPFQRVKALHDWVVTRLHYDKKAIEPGAVRPPQDAESVFAAGKGVCEGYARLMIALGRETGDTIAYVWGDVRENDGSAAPSSHAWNAVDIRGKWYLIDATWDDPTGGAGDNYRTDYLFIPASVAVFDHYPDDRRWQMLATPLSRGDFLRQPLARPGLAREGLTLVSPERSTIEVSGPLDVQLENPRRAKLMVTVGSSDSNCGVHSDVKPHWTCQLPSGVSRVVLWHETAREGTYEYVAEFRATRR